MGWDKNYNGALCAPGMCTNGQLAFLSFLTHYFASSSVKFSHETYDGPEEFDFIIVGGGAAGCVVANRLSEIKNWKVLLLENGGEQPLISEVPGLQSFLAASNLDYGYITQSEPRACGSSKDHRCYWPRGKVMGGSGAMNSMHFVRGHRWDYDNWRDLGNQGWGWDSVLPYFKKMEDFKIPDVLQKNPQYHGTGGYQSVGRPNYYDYNSRVLLKGWKELGLREIDYNSGDNLGTAKMQYAFGDGARENSNSGYIRPIQGKRPNLTIRTNSLVNKVIIDPKTKCATGVKYRTESSKVDKVATAKKEVILSAGTIESPKLLMLSGVGPAENLKESGIPVILNVPGVGKNLHNHVAIVPWVVNTTIIPEEVDTKMLHEHLVQWLRTREGPMTINSFMDNIAFLRTKYERNFNVPDIQVGYIKFKFIDGIPNFLVPYYDGFNLEALHLAPKSRGEIKLDPKNPVDGQPLIYPNYFSHPNDLAALVEGACLTKRLTETNAFKNAGFQVSKNPGQDMCDHLKFESNDYYRCLATNYTGGIGHMVGTCKMGYRPEKSVVDYKLKVHGIERLRVIDASIMPEITRGNTYAPTVMIAEKGSDMIKEYWMKKQYGTMNLCQKCHLGLYPKSLCPVNPSCLSARQNQMPDSFWPIYGP